MGRLTASAPGIVELPEIESPGHGHGGWIVTVFDNDHNTIEEVTHILMIATQCDRREAEIETWEVHHLGRSVVHWGEEEACRGAAAIIATIGIRVEVSTE